MDPNPEVRIGVDPATPMTALKQLTSALEAEQRQQ